MSFSVYYQEGDRFQFVQPIKLTGPDGVLAKYLQSHAEMELPFTWQLSSAELIKLSDPALNPRSHIVAIDMMPESLVEICLYRLTRIQGVSEECESDIVLSSKLLEQGSVSKTANDHKRGFKLSSGDRSRQMLEAMRLTGGTHKGQYFWARPKMDIGAAVCPASAPTAEVITP